MKHNYELFDWTLVTEFVFIDFSFWIVFFKSAFSFKSLFICRLFNCLWISISSTGSPETLQNHLAEHNLFSYFSCKLIFSIKKYQLSIWNKLGAHYHQFYNNVVLILLLLKNSLEERTCITTRRDKLTLNILPAQHISELRKCL